MMRPWNWPSRWLWSLVTVVMSTLNDAFVTLVPAIVIEPVTSLVRPTAAASWPKSVLLHAVARGRARPDLPGAGERTRAVEPLVVAAFGRPVVVDGVVAVESESFGGGSPSMKWMYTNGPPTTRTSTTTTPPMTQRSQERFFGVGEAMRDLVSGR